MGFGGGNGCVFSVGELLRLFCSSLQEQIKHRMYFYKMATLVREGMIIVHNSGLNGDPTSAKVERERRGDGEERRGEVSLTRVSVRLKLIVAC